MKLSIQVCLTPMSWYCVPGTEVSTLHSLFYLVLNPMTGTVITILQMLQEVK